MAEDIAKVVKAAGEQGFKVYRRQSDNHWEFVCPDGFVKPYSGTPSDRRAIRNHIAVMKAHGFIWPWTPKMRRAARKAQRKTP